MPRVSLDKEIGRSEFFRFSIKESSLAVSNAFSRLLAFTFFGLATGKNQCKSGCSTLRANEQDLHAVQGPVGVLLGHSKTWATQSPRCCFPTPGGHGSAAQRKGCRLDRLLPEKFEGDRDQSVNACVPSFGL